MMENDVPPPVKKAKCCVDIDGFNCYFKLFYHYRRIEAGLY